MPEKPEPLQISISRDSIFTGKKQWAVFDGHCKCVKGFVEYTDEPAALAEAKAWVKQCGLPGADLEPTVIYPSIKKIRMS